MELSDKLWIPNREWAGSDAYIIGGGPSLAGFNFRVLTGLNTIGCNHAFQLGPDIVKVVLFSDKGFFNQIVKGGQVKDLLSKFPGYVVTSLLSMTRENAPWLKVMLRERDELVKSPVRGLTMLGGSGGSAINLALLMGAKRVFLLGYDCKSTKAKPNWHEDHRFPPADELYQKFIKGFETIARELPVKFPGCEVINLGPDSELTCFPKADIADYLTIHG
jgi:hypothetical protein